MKQIKCKGKINEKRKLKGTEDVGGTIANMLEGGVER
jgi:hypothetical protein